MRKSPWRRIEAEAHEGFFDGLRIGSLCTGYGGLDAAVRSVIGGELAWVADNDPDAAKLLAYRYPDAPNLGDITKVDWAGVAPADVILAGFPCTDISCAGRRAGLREGTRSGIWANCFEAITALRPGLVVIENVRNIATIYADSDLEPCPGCVGDRPEDTVLRALGAVLGDLASIGFDAEWCCVRASDTGAPHRRERVFVLAWPAADTQRDRLQGGGSAAGACAERPAETGFGCGPAAGGPGSPADAHGPGLQVGGVEHDGPQCAATERGSGEFSGHNAGLNLLPAPEASDSTGGRVSSEMGGKRPPGVDHLLKTPTAQLGVNGGSQPPDKRRAGGHGPTLADQVEHELGFEATLGSNGGDSLLPTPNASDSQGGPKAVPERRTSNGPDFGPRLRDVAPTFLPTPVVADARNATAGRSPGSAGHSGTTLSDVFHQMSVNVDWGKYELAVRRWEHVFGIPAPCPVRPGKTNYVLAPEFPEWMMGLPAGWVTGVAGLSRNAMLKLIGNGVVPQQGALGVRALLDATGWLPLRLLAASRAFSSQIDSNQTPQEEIA